MSDELRAAAELVELQRPLAEIEKAFLSSEFDKFMTKAGTMLLRRALFELDKLKQVKQTVDRYCRSHLSSASSPGQQNACREILELMKMR